MISVKLEGLDKAQASIDPKTVQRAERAAIDRTAKAAVTVASEEIRNVYNVKKSDLDPRIKITPPRMDNLQASITISGKGMSLAFFGARQVMGNRVITRSGKNLKSGKVSRKMRAAGPVPQGVVVEVVKGKQTALLRTAFMAKVTAGKSGSHIGVYRRLGKKRLPIYEKGAISVASMAENAKVLPNVLQRINERWAVEFPRQLDYYRSQAGGR
jgi:hypothetical protein